MKTAKQVSLSMGQLTSILFKTNVPADQLISSYSLPSYTVTADIAAGDPSVYCIPKQPVAMRKENA